MTIKAQTFEEHCSSRSISIQSGRQMILLAVKQLQCYTMKIVIMMDKSILSSNVSHFHLGTRERPFDISYKFLMVLLGCPQIKCDKDANQLVVIL